MTLLVRNTFQPEQSRRREDEASGISGETPRYATRHFSIAEVADLWNLSEDFIRQLFENEKDVVVLLSLRSGPGKRRYRTLRIPEFVVERVHRRLSKV